MNSVFMIGRLTADPELKYIPSTGNAICNMQLAVNRQFSKEKQADFFKVTVFGKTAENCANYLAKGRQVAIRGSVQNNNYTDKDGKTVYGTVIIAEQVQFLEKSEVKTEGQAQAPADGVYEELKDEDVPF